MLDSLSIAAVGRRPLSLAGIRRRSRPGPGVNLTRWMGAGYPRGASHTPGPGSFVPWSRPQWTRPLLARPPAYHRNGKLVHMVSTADPLSITPAALRVRRLGEPGVVSPMAGLLQSRVSSPHYVHELDR